MLKSLTDVQNVRAPGISSLEEAPSGPVTVCSQSTSDGSRTSDALDIVGGRPYIEASSLPQSDLAV
jgi:hypothetical protein